MKTLSISLLFVCFFLFSCVSSPETPMEELADVSAEITWQLLDSLDWDNLSKMAVLPVVDNQTGDPDSFSMIFADEMITAIIQESEGELEIFERTQVSQLLKEAQFAATGIVSEDTAVEVGKMIGVDAVIIGTFQQVGDVLRINVRMVMIESGKVTSAANAEISINTYKTIIGE